MRFLRFSGQAKGTVMAFVSCGCSTPSESVLKLAPGGQLKYNFTDECDRPIVA
jgi:hypothetical protein